MDKFDVVAIIIFLTCLVVIMGDYSIGVKADSITFGILSVLFIGIIKIFVIDED